MLGILCKSTVILLLLVSTCFADNYYLFIKKESDASSQVPKGEEAGHSEKGDVVDITPATAQFEPTTSEKSTYVIITADLSEEEKNQLLGGVYIDNKGLINDDSDDVLVKARKLKIDFEKLNIKEQKDSIEKSSLINNIFVKP